jgi:hypothetical protein
MRIPVISTEINLNIDGFKLTTTCQIRWSQRIRFHARFDLVVIGFSAFSNERMITASFIPGDKKHSFGIVDKCMPAGFKE